MRTRFSLPLLLLVLICALPSVAATRGGSIPVAHPLFPPNNWWNTDVSAAPVDGNSAAFIQFIGPTKGLHPDFGGDAGGGDVYGFPYLIVDGSQPKKTVTFAYDDESDGVNHDTNQPFPFYPIPDEAITMTGWVEGGQPGDVDQRNDSDRHILIVDKSNSTLYELYNVWFNGSQWVAGSGAFFDMNTNNRRPETWTSADAAGLAILPGLLRYDEVIAEDEIRHAFRVTVRASNGYVYPASHAAGSNSSALPMGARLRLKASKDISGFPADVQKIFRAMKKYGLIVADNGSDMYISGSYDTRWNNDVLNPAFSALKASDFEVVQRGWKPSVTLVLTVPPNTGAGDAASMTVTAYDADYNVATGYRGTVHFTSTDGAATLPFDYTFTSGDAGVHVFNGGLTLRTTGLQRVTGTDVADATINGTRASMVGPATPANLVATATSSTSVSISWTASAGAAQYELLRTAGPGTTPVTFTVPSTVYSDTSAAAGVAYLYKVRALDAATRVSGYSAPDLATTVVFVDEPLTAGTLIKGAHFTALRQAVNAARATAGLGAMTFTDPALTQSVAARALHLQELRAGIAEARAALALPPVTFTDATVNGGSTTIRAVHVQELRGAVK